MKVEIRVSLAPELQACLRQLIEVLRDLTTVIAPLTGFRVRED